MPSVASLTRKGAPLSLTIVFLRVEELMQVKVEPQKRSLVRVVVVPRH